MYGSMAAADRHISWKPVSAITLTPGGTLQPFFANASVTIENALDRRGRRVSDRPYVSPEEFRGLLQTRRRTTVGVEVRLR